MNISKWFARLLGKEEPYSPSYQFGSFIINPNHYKKWSRWRMRWDMWRNRNAPRSTSTFDEITRQIEEIKVKKK